MPRFDYHGPAQYFGSTATHVLRGDDVLKSRRFVPYKEIPFKEEEEL
jgi:hypothetical protein